MKEWPLRLFTRLQAYLMVEGSPWPLAIFRVLLASSLVFEASENVKRIKYYTPKTFHFPYVDFITPLPAEQIQQIFEWQYIFAVMVLIGALTPLAALGVILTQGYVFFICQLNFRNHIYMALLFTFLLMVTPCARTLSVDAGLRWAYWTLRGQPEKAPPPQWVNAIGQRVIGLQVFAIYLYATLHKINPGFLTGYPLTKALSRAIPKSFLAQWGWITPEQAQWMSERVAEPQWAALVAYLTVFSEGFLALGLLFPVTRPAAVLVGIGLHLSIGLSMNIITFGAMLVSAYVCFWMPRQRPIIPATRINTDAPSD